MLDVIITSTCRKTIFRTIDSFLKNIIYSSRFNFIINIDVLRPNVLPSILRYLESLGVSEININFNVGSFHSNLSNALAFLFNSIQTPYFFNLQDDWIFKKKINLDVLLRLFEKHTYIDNIRFSKQKIRDKAWMYHLSNEISKDCLCANTNMVIDGVCLVKTPTWSLNPSVVRTSIVKKFTTFPPGVRAETYICREYLNTLKRDGCYIWGQIGDGPSVEDIGRNRIREWLKKKKVGLKHNFIFNVFQGRR